MWTQSTTLQKEKRKKREREKKRGEWGSRERGRAPQSKVPLLLANCPFCVLHSRGFRGCDLQQKIPTSLGCLPIGQTI